MDNALTESMGFEDGVIPMDNFIDEEENKSPEESSPEKNKEGKIAPKSEDGKKDESSKKSDKTNEKEPPFHNHPRWKRMTEDLKTKENELSELKTTVKQIQQQLQQNNIKDKENNPEAWFVEKYGYDVDLWKQYLKDSKALELPKEEMPIYDETFWNKQIDKDLDELSDKHNIDFDTEKGKKIKEELFDFMLKNDITKYQSKYNKETYDFEKGWKLFVQFKNNGRKSTVNKNKEVAGMAKSGSKAENYSGKNIPIETLRNMGYKDFYEML